MNHFKLFSITALSLACAIVNFAYAVPPVDLQFGDTHAQVNTVNEVDTKIDQLKTTLTGKIDVLNNAKDALSLKLETVEAKLELLSVKTLFNKMFPVGSIYITFTNQYPPLHGEHSVQWELLPEGYAVMTASLDNTGNRSGSSRLDNGSVVPHALTINEMPSHNHSVNQQSTGSGGGGGGWDFGNGAATNFTGGNQAHSHSLDIYNQKLLCWRRIS